MTTGTSGSLTAGMVDRRSAIAMTARRFRRSPFNDNTFTLAIQPGAARRRSGGADAESAGGVLQHRKPRPHGGGRRTANPGGARAGQYWNLRIWGTIPLRDRGRKCCSAIDDPALYAAKACRQLLEQRGIAVSGSAVARHLYPEDVADLKEA